ncbi:MAG: glycosyl hydrolase family 28-related protein [Planctomycetota bacterium]|jgi:hypothetical protein|nr:glycosyl hydrolase family 28-related protein [Planctomycetota bacterium]
MNPISTQCLRVSAPRVLVLAAALAGAALLPAVETVTAADLLGPDGQVYPDFSRAGIPGGIPELPVVAKATDFGAVPNDDKDDSAAIQAAIAVAVAKGGGAVLLPVGDYLIDSPIRITRGGVALRGEDRERTRLIPRFQGQDLRDGARTVTMIEVVGDKVRRNYDVYPAEAISRGDTSMVLREKDAGRVKLGDVVVLAATPPSDVVATLAPNLQKQAGDGSYGSIYSWQYLEVTAVDGATITVAQPIRLDLALDQTPKLMHVPNLLQGSGVEDLTIDQSIADKGIHGLSFARTRGCWASGVTVLNIGNYPVSWDRCWQFEMRDCVLDSSRSAGGARAYFGFGFACDGVIENVRATRLRHLSISMTSNGLVFRKCFLENIDINFHLNWPYEVLFEQCHVDSGVGPDAAADEKKRGSYGHGIYTPRLDGDMHCPAGPRLSFYNNQIFSDFDGLMLGGGATRDSLVVYNVFDVKQSFAAVIRRGSEGSVVRDNVFVLRAPHLRKRWMALEQYGHAQPELLSGAVLFPHGEPTEVSFINNRFYGAPQGSLFTGAQPKVNRSNESIAAVPTRAGATIAGTVALVGDWRVQVVQDLPPSPSGGKRHADPGLSDAARALMGEGVDDTQWPVMAMPSMFNREPLDFNHRDGEVVIRRQFDLDAEQLATAVSLSLGAVDDHDEVWINGQQVGATAGPDAWSAPRTYTVPAGLLRATGNTIAIRVWDAFGGGGLSGTANELWIGVPREMEAVPLPNDIAAPVPPVPSLFLWQREQREMTP